MMELYDKFKLLVDKFCEQNADVIEPNQLNITLLRTLAYEAGMIAIDHQLEIMRSMKKESAK